MFTWVAPLKFHFKKFQVDMQGFQRQGFLLTSIDTPHKIAEVSPLPKFSKESLLEVAQELSRPLGSSLPSIQFGTCSLLSKTTPQDSYPINALLSGPFEEISKKIPLALNYPRVKLKIGDLTFDEAHLLIKRLIDKVPLSLDINRKWSLEKALFFFSNYPKDAFEYIEEPVQDPKDLALFFHNTALDETLIDHQEIPHFPWIKAWIFKPMLLGNRLEPLLELAQKRDLLPILSSCYETGIGIYHLCNLKEQYPLFSPILGVDTYRNIKKDLLKYPHAIENGSIFLSKRPYELLL